jgi:hypothetical protein
VAANSARSGWPAVHIDAGTQPKAAPPPGLIRSLTVLEAAGRYTGAFRNRLPSSSAGTRQFTSTAGGTSRAVARALRW